MEKDRQKQRKFEFENEQEQTLPLNEVLPQAIDDAMEDDEEDL